MKAKVFGLFEPVSMAVIVLFWALAPTSLTHNPLTVVVATSLTTALVLALEFVNERHASWRLTAREFWTDIFYNVLITTVIAKLVKKLDDDPLTSARHALGITTPWVAHLPFALQVFLAVFLIEFGQYWMHRAMHNTFLWWTHAPHHHITQLNATKGAVGNPIELFLVSLSVVALFDIPESAVFCALNVGALVSSCAHANVVFDRPRWYGFFWTTIEAHSKHHSARYEETRCNYANALILIDRTFGTFRDGESEIVGQDERKRLTIWQQFVFPLRPLIATIKARRGASAPLSG
jgi:sterol desaturase/sphingolipid hydroxylase (fatty acid hydroxylase superfamily)